MGLDARLPSTPTFRPQHCLLSPPGDEESQESTDTPSESETSCPLITTGTTTGMARVCFYGDKSFAIKS